MWGALGAGMLNQLFMNTSNRIGTGASLRRQQLREQERQTRLEAAAGIVGRVEGAKAAGIHPLAALGSNVGGASMPSIGSSFNSSVDFGALESSNREMKMRKEELEYSKIAEKQAASDRKTKEALDLKESEARINLIRAQEARERKMISDSDRDFLAAQAAHTRQASNSANPLRVGARKVAPSIPDQYVPVRDRFGKIHYVPNPDLYDLELPESVGAGTLLLPEVPTLKSRVRDWWQYPDRSPTLPATKSTQGAPSRRYRNTRR